MASSSFTLTRYALFALTIAALLGIIPKSTGVLIVLCCLAAVAYYLAPGKTFSQKRELIIYGRVI